MSETPLSESFHPFPGLRPFSKPEDSGFFFGRDEQVSEVIAKLRTEGLVVVVGGSGSGKSSLVLAGVVRELQNEAFRAAGNFWVPIPFTPGTNFNSSQDFNTPITRLARKFAELPRDNYEVRNPSEPIDDLDRLTANYAESLRKVDGLSEIARHLREQVLAAEGLDVTADVTPRFLVVVDQFEEIFHRSNQVLAAGDLVRSDCWQLITRLLESKAAANRWIVAGRKHADAPLVFVALTMRSEHLNDCPIYNGLPNLINSSFYLLGKLDSTQVTEAVESPANLFLFACERRFRQEMRRQRAPGEDIQARTSNLPDRIELAASVSDRIIEAFEALNDDPEHFDQLPLLQHLLYRLWESALARTRASAGTGSVVVPDRIADEDLAVAAYPGGEKRGANLLRDCLDNWANRIWNSEMDEAILARWENIFRKLAYKELFGETYTQVRLRVADIAAELGLPGANKKKRATEELATLLSPWLHPHEYLFLDKDSATLKVSHESFVRGWLKLRRWTDEEHEPVMELVRVLRESADWLNATTLDAKKHLLLSEPRLNSLSQLGLTVNRDPSGTVEVTADRYFDRLPTALCATTAWKALPDFVSQSDEALRKLKIEERKGRSQRFRRNLAMYALPVAIAAAVLLISLFNFATELGNKESSRYTNYLALAELRKNMGDGPFSSPSLEALSLPLRGVLLAYSEGRKHGQPHSLSELHFASRRFFEPRVEQLNKLSPMALRQEFEVFERLLASGLWLVSSGDEKSENSQNNMGNVKKDEENPVVVCYDEKKQWNSSTIVRNDKALSVRVFDKEKMILTSLSVPVPRDQKLDCKMVNDAQVSDLLAFVPVGTKFAVDGRLEEMLVLQIQKTNQYLVQRYRVTWTPSAANDPEGNHGPSPRRAVSEFLSSYGCSASCKATFGSDDGVLFLLADKKTTGWFRHYSLASTTAASRPSHQWKLTSGLPIDHRRDDQENFIPAKKDSANQFCRKLFADQETDGDGVPFYFLADDVKGAYDIPGQSSVRRTPICIKVMPAPSTSASDGPRGFVELALVLESREGRREKVSLFQTRFSGTVSDSNYLVYLGKDGSAYDGWLGIADERESTMKIRPWSAPALARIACRVYSDSDAKTASADSKAFSLAIIERVYSSSTANAENQTDGGTSGTIESTTKKKCAALNGQPIASNPG